MAAHTHSHGHNHDHGHAHAHAHAHSHALSGPPTRALRWALVLTVAILLVEGIGGWISNSLALVADAGHVLTDAGALALSLFVAWLARQPGSRAKTYGYLRWEILAALINGTTLLLISAWIVVEAVMRFRAPEPVAGGTMFVVAVIGLVVNGVSAWLLHGVREGGLNVRAAYLHVLGDLLASAGTVAAALIIRATGWYDADPIVSLLTTILIVSGAWRLVRESVDVLLEAAPAHIDIDHVRGRLEGISGVESIHDLHVWTLTSGMVAMSAHAVVRELGDNQKVLASAYAELKALGIQHSTIQLEESQLVECDEHAHP